jgi:hypothetical protein
LGLVGGAGRRDLFFAENDEGACLGVITGKAQKVRKDFGIDLLLPKRYVLGYLLTKKLFKIWSSPQKVDS